MDSELLSAIDAFDLESYLEKHDAECIHGDEWIMDCPRCGKRKLTVNVERRMWHCWICEEYRVNRRGKRYAARGAGGVLALVRWLEGCERDRAIHIVRSGVVAVTSKGVGALPELRLQQSELNSVVAPAPEILPPPCWSCDVSKIEPYLQSRGISAKDVKDFGLFYCFGGRYANRLVFPIWEQNRLVYYQARAMWTAEQQAHGRYIKVLNPPLQSNMASPADVLMNLDTARQYPRVALVEGPVDCVHAGPSSVCTFGKKISTNQILKIKAAGVRNIDLMWDGPTSTEPMGAWPEMYRYGELLSGVFDDVRLVFLPSGDPGDYPREQLDYYRKLGRSIDRLQTL